MAPRTKPKSTKKSKQSRFVGILRNYAEEVSKLLYHYDYFPYLAFGILLVEILLNVFIIQRVSYTEIDWKAYMQEVEGVINGTFDYSQLKGDTGPLVYPAGFVYIFSTLYFLTGYGESIRIAQYIYMVIYLITLYLLYRLYKVCQKVPPYVLALSCCTAYRIHSIYVLRMFNDPIAVMLLYLSLNLFLMNKWTIGSVVYSLAVSVKMNILLYAPALFGAYVILLGIKETVKQLIICASVQLFLAVPFLLVNPYAYLKQSFDLGRVFFYRWTVNWRFIPEDVFLNFYFHIILLVIHMALIIYFSVPMIKYFKSYAALRQLEKDVMPQLRSHEQVVNMGSLTQLFLLPFFLSNFIGIVCSRSLHYQFYVWYYHTLPFLLWSTTFSNKFRLLLLGVIEFCWNTYPSTRLSSICLFICHTAILSNLIRKFGHKIKN
jgi:alpha-1,3-mannosyltransferase